MDPQWIQSIVEQVIQQLEQKDPAPKPKGIPIAVSARHVHLSEQHVAALFGPSYKLTKRSDLSQPNQFAAEETVTLAGPKGTIERVRILGPSRKLTQVEISQTDAFKLGVKPPIRQSGDIKGSAPITIIGPKGSIYLPEGLIIAQAHIHMAPSDAEHFNVQDGQIVQVAADTERPMTFGRVLVRVSPSYRLEMHIDTDEGNAAFIQKGQIGELIVDGKPVGCSSSATSSSPVPMNSSEPAQPLKQAAVFEGKLLSQHDIKNSSEPIIRIHRKTIVTPLAKDTARDLGKKIEVIEA